MDKKLINAYMKVISEQTDEQVDEQAEAASIPSGKPTVEQVMEAMKLLKEALDANYEDPHVVLDSDDRTVTVEVDKLFKNERLQGVKQTLHFKYVTMRTVAVTIGSKTFKSVKMNNREVYQDLARKMANSCDDPLEAKECIRVVYGLYC